MGIRPGGGESESRIGEWGDGEGGGERMKRSGEGGEGGGEGRRGREWGGEGRREGVKEGDGAGESIERLPPSPCAAMEQKAHQRDTPHVEEEGYEHEYGAPRAQVWSIVFLGAGHAVAVTAEGVARGPCSVRSDQTIRVGRKGGGGRWRGRGGWFGRGRGFGLLYGRGGDHESGRRKGGTREEIGRDGGEED